MGTYQCIDCELYYCVECDPGEDTCEDCHSGPRCNDCAADHVYAHGGPEDESYEDSVDGGEK